MGWYANGIIPIGAWLVGIVSGLGYAVASRYLQVKLGRAFILGMASTAVLDYAVAQYLTYQHLIEVVHVSEERYSFLQYFQDICEKMSFTRSGSSEPGSPLGGFGYAYKVLEAAGYVLGAMVPSWVVSQMPYCRQCQLYMKQHLRGHIRSQSLWSAVKGLKKKERVAALGAAVLEVASQANAVSKTIASATLSESVAAVSNLAKAADKKSVAAASVVVELKKCPNCESHHVSYTLATWAVNKKPARRLLTKIDKQAAETAAAAELPA